MTFSEPADGRGCPWCREKWIWRSDEPRLLGQSRDFQVQVYRCGRCGTYWEEGIVNPRVITRDQALERLPDLEERERLAGL
ncbi:hypothetical protein ACFC1I_12315 [Microbacterium sp. NPDC056044]|uniref:hypothetical protein n=1 Tax=Microbacterium sp. NPDC056044 TaxID=3345690 RepID=UPI0035DF7C3E